MIVADTHAFYWWVHDSPRLSRASADALESSDQVAIAAITIWELAQLIQRRRIGVPGDARAWLHQVTTLPTVRVVPVSVEIAVRAARLPDPIRDPADRLIVATALEHGVPLVTKDARIHEANVVDAIW